MSINREKTIHKKQLITVILVLIGVVAVVAIGLRFSQVKNIASAPRKDAYLLPENTIKEQDQWMVMGEKHINDIATRQKRLEEIINSMPVPRSDQYLQKPEIQNRLENIPLPSPQDTYRPSSKRRDLPQAAMTFISKDPTKIEHIMPSLNPLGADVSTSESDGVDVVDVNRPMQQSDVDFIPAGSFAKVVLLSGFDAPTGGQAAQNALPVVMRVKSFMHMPNDFQDNLKECFITGSGYGDLASERVFVRTERLSCIFKNNRVIEKKIKGHLVGEDASFGMRGKLVSKQGALLARSFVAGMFSGLGNSVAAQSQMMQASPLGTVTTIDPARAEQAALGSGISTSTGKIADFYLQQANLIFPVIEVAAMRIGEVFLVEGIHLNENGKNETHDYGNGKASLTMNMNHGGQS